MEDLIYLFLIFTVICFVVAVVLAGFVVAASVASVCVFGAAVAAFSVTMYRCILHRGGVNAVSGPGEPSFRAYYRGQVWRDLGFASSVAWKSALHETERIRNLVPSSWDDKLQVVVRLALTAYSIVGLAIGALLALVIGIIPALIIVLFAAGAWVLGAPLRALEQLRRKRTGAYFDCQDCHDRFPLPQYVCPSCDARHVQLAPGPFGVLMHRCTCGARLPSVQSRGRERLAAECPRGHPLGEGIGVVRTFHVPVAGGPSTGKSTFLAAALIELDEAAKSGTLATTVQSTSHKAYDRILDGFRQGVRPAKTSGLPPAMVAEVGGRTKSVLLYAYDVAGEAYGNEEELRRDPAHGLAEGVVLLVDPFALDRVRGNLQDEIDEAPELRPSLESPQRMLERLIGVLDEQGVDLSQVSAAVCVTKVDALGIGDAIAGAPGEGDHERARAWLEQAGAGNFLRAAEGAFGTVQCFGVSALGRTPGSGSGPFTPKGASAPLLWLLTRAGIQPAAPGEAAETTTTKIAAAAALDVSPKRPIFTAPLDAVAQRGYAANFGVGILAAGVLALGLLPLSLSGAGNDYGSSAPVAASVDPGSTTTDDATTDDATRDDATTDDTSEEGTTPSRPNPKAASTILRKHFQRINSGDYDGAFALMSSAYQAKNPQWTDEPSTAQPFINVVEAGPTRFEGGGLAYVHIKFYGRDKYDTSKSDTQCRRFEGDARMVKVDGDWRYDPLGNRYGQPTVIDSDLGVCTP